MNTSFFRVSNIYFILAFLFLAGAVGYGALKFQIYSAQKQAIRDNRSRLTELTVQADVSAKEFFAFGENYIKKQAELAKNMAAILPEDESYTNLTRLLDDYFAEHDRPGNPIFQSSLRYGKGEQTDQPNIWALPLSMNIEATRDNFFKFLDFVQNSGSLENGQRLMKIHSIQLNFPEGGEVVKNARQLINFTVDMSAYFHESKVAR